MTLHTATCFQGDNHARTELQQDAPATDAQSLVFSRDTEAVSPSSSLFAKVKARKQTVVLQEQARSTVLRPCFALLASSLTGFRLKCRLYNRHKFCNARKIDARRSCGAPRAGEGFVGCWTLHECYNMHAGAIDHDAVASSHLQVAPWVLPLDAAGTAYEGYLLSNVRPRLAPSEHQFVKGYSVTVLLPQQSTTGCCGHYRC